MAKTSMDRYPISKYRKKLQAAGTLITEWKRMKTTRRTEVIVEIFKTHRPGKVPFYVTRDQKEIEIRPVKLFEDANLQGWERDLLI